MQQDLRQRTKQFALRIIKLYLAVPSKGAGFVLGPQLLKAGTSVGAHYREACRAKSNADFISKIEGALQELEELVIGSNYCPMVALSLQNDFRH
jgi:four helix bundle protein